MASSGAANKHTVRIQQLLFGYDRGHGLLASSDSESKRIAASILSDTDWDPRVSSRVDGYVSARPVEGEKTYALMKTWRAPEMPRPGCVWTHVLLVGDADLSRIPDLSILYDHLCRPDSVGEYSRFKKEIVIDPTNDVRPSEPLGEQTVWELVRLTYDSGANNIWNERSDEINRAFLALWSQQWPSLRRRFSFRTAPLSAARIDAGGRFEVELVQTGQPRSRSEPEWQFEALQLIARDIVANNPSDLRRFLWRYGADTHGNRHQLVSLTHIYRKMRAAENQHSLMGVVNEIAEFFPKLDDARLLKSDLTQPMNASYSLLPEIDHFEIVRGVRSLKDPSSFPALGAVDRRTIKVWIKERPLETAHLASDTADGEDDFATSLFDGISPLKNKDFVWQLMPLSERAFVRASGSSIAHLADDRTKNVRDETLISMLNATKAGDQDVKNIVPFLMERESAELVKRLNDIDAAAVTVAVIETASKSDENAVQSVHPTWIECLKDNPTQILHYAQNSVERRSQLLMCRYLLNADSRHTPLPTWSKRLEVVANDLTDVTDLEFSVFLLIQALRTPEKGADVILRNTFDAVYGALAANRLSFRTEMHLSDYLPSIGWFNNWDKCLRLKIAAVSVFKHLEMPKKKLLNITSKDQTRESLEEIWSK